MRGNITRGDPAAGLADLALWRRSQIAEITEDEAERFLDLAGFADGRLDPDDGERIAEWLAGDPVAASDAAAARALAHNAEAMPEQAIARAAALVGGGGGGPQPAAIIPFPFGRRNRPRLQGMAGWGSLVAAMAVASWLGFTLGVDTSLSFSQIRQGSEDSFLREFLDPSPGFMRDLTEGPQT
jgi:anti-sigma factor RsiW